MNILGIDPSTCNGCGLCVQECPANRFTMADQKAVYSDPQHWCTGCGHCVAVCPQDAVCYDGEERAQELEGPMPGYESIRKLLLTKRTVRRYQDKDVPEEIMEKILSVIRHAPSGHNAQPCQYVIVKDPAIKRLMADTTIQSFQSFKKLIKMRKLIRPFLPKPYYQYMDDPCTLGGIDAMTEEYRSGVDNIFFDAPVLIVVHVPDMGGLSYVDPAIAVTYGMLAAHGLGLGSCWGGFAMITLKKDKQILQKLHIPKGRFIAGVMTLGYPCHSYHRVPLRNPLQVEWLEGSRVS